jgi:hypothetical protein
MTDTCTGGHESPGPRIRRRRFLATLGSGGLAASAMLFGRSELAAAAATASCGCCHLVYCPPTTTMSSCLAANHYVWTCASSPTVTCQCCEKRNHDGVYYASAYSCRPT